MAILSILNLFLVSAIITVVGFGVLLNFKYASKNAYRGYLISLLIFWGVIMGFVFTKYFVDGQAESEFTRDIANVPVLIMGIGCFMTLISYPVIILHSQLIKLRRWFIISSPLIIVVTIYMLYHFICGINPFTSYNTYGELFDNIGSLSVILRLALVLTLVIYIIVFIRNAWYVVPFYNNYIKENIADSECNVDWVRILLKHIIVVSVMYLAMVFSSSPAVNTLYLVSVLGTFIYIVEMSLFHHTSEYIEPLNIKWSRTKGWYVEKVETEISNENNYLEMGEKIDEWMNSEGYYKKVEFTTEDILHTFPTLTRDDLANIFKLRDESFQSYVRRYRIKAACEIIEQNPSNVYPKQLFSSVGFSHYSSFSRSFNAVMETTPSEYIKKIIEKNPRGGGKPRP